MLKLRWSVMRSLNVIAALVLAFAVRNVDAREWTRVHPQITSGVRALSGADATAILSEFCADALRHVERIGLTCSTRQLGHGFSDIVDAEFHPEGVIYGHFLSATSEDAVVSGWSAETHPD